MVNRVRTQKAIQSQRVVIRMGGDLLGLLDAYTRRMTAESPDVMPSRATAVRRLLYGVLSPAGPEFATTRRADAQFWSSPLNDRSSRISHRRGA